MKKHSPATLYTLVIGALLLISSFVWPARLSFTFPIHHEIYEFAPEVESSDKPSHIDFAGGTVVHLSIVHITLLAAGGILLTAGVARWVMENKTS